MNRIFISLLAVAVALSFAMAASAQPATAQLAPAQLRLAESELQLAEEALAQRDYERARQLAAQAGLDARIAYGMTDSAFLRREAAQVHEQSARLRWLTAQERVSARR
ncbi:MAG TPA: DUF4398 domain-containing protein [Burkholderiales bacterium]